LKREHGGTGVCMSRVNVCDHYIIFNPNKY